MVVRVVSVSVVVDVAVLVIVVVARGRYISSRACTAAKRTAHFSRHSESISRNTSSCIEGSCGGGSAKAKIMEVPSQSWMYCVTAMRALGAFARAMTVGLFWDACK